MADQSRSDSSSSSKTSVSAVLDASETIEQWVERLLKNKIQALLSEFATIKAEKITGTTMAWDQNMPLNRYIDTDLLDDTRVILNDGLPQPYIHASYVDGFQQPKAFIIAQAPLPTAIVDYWRMVWQERITLIVCLTALKERRTTKADIFFPASTDRPFRAWPFRVSASSINPLPGFPRSVLVRLRMRCWFGKRGMRERSLLLLYYGNWPDRAVPRDTRLFLKFVKLVKKLEKWTSDRAPPGSGSPPALVHCGAGIGRSATLVACRIAVDQAEATNEVDIPGVVRKMRAQRAGSVETSLQYVFINLVVAEAVRQRGGTVSEASTSQRIGNVSYVVPSKAK